MRSTSSRRLADQQPLVTLELLGTARQGFLFGRGDDDDAVPVTDDQITGIDHRLADRQRDTEPAAMATQAGNKAAAGRRTPENVRQ